MNSMLDIYCHQKKDSNGPEEKRSKGEKEKRSKGEKEKRSMGEKPFGKAKVKRQKLKVEKIICGIRV